MGCRWAERMGRAINRLTARQVTSLPEGMHPDGGGLYLRVRAGGRSWVWRHRYAGRRRDMGLGSAEQVSLKEARALAEAGRQALRRGEDPMIRANTAPARVAPAAAPTFEAAVRAFMAAHGTSFSNIKHRAQWIATLETYAARLMPLPVDRIGTADVEACLLPIWTAKPETARRVRQRIERVLAGSIARGDRPPPNPAALADNLAHLLPVQAADRVRHHPAVLAADAPEAFARLWRWRGKGASYAALVTLCLTVLRSGEVRRLQWDDIDGETITVPAERMKARRAHRVPVTPALAAWWREVDRWEGLPLVHPSPRGLVLSDMAMSQAMRRAGLAPAVPHGWRATFAEWAAGAGWEVELIEDQLAHLIGTRVTRAYLRGDFLERRRPMVEAWGEYLFAGLDRF